MYNSNESGSNRLFITQIPRDVDERELMSLFGTFGEVLDAKIIPSQHQSVTCKRPFFTENYLQLFIVSIIRLRFIKLCESQYIGSFPGCGAVPQQVSIC